MLINAEGNQGMENVDRLEKIKNSLKEWSFLNKTYRSNPDVDDFSVPVMKSASICELVLQEILIENEIEVNNGFVPVQDKRYRNGLPVLTYCSKMENAGIIPSQIKGLIDVIRHYRNAAAHLRGITEGEYVKFNEAFFAFLCWVYDEYDFLKSTDWFGEYRIEAENALILEMGTYSESIQFELSRLKKLKAYSDEIDKIESVRRTEELEHYKEMMLQIVGESTAEIKEFIKDSTKMISDKIDNMAEILEKIVGQINSYQTLVQNQIDLAMTEDEVERLVQAYMNTCVDRIVTDIDSKYSSNTYDAEKEKLKSSLGESAWNKLSAESQNFLISAKVTYNYLVNIKSAIDYSGVCLLVTKALEVEMKRRFYSDYMIFLKEKYPGKKNYNKFPTALLSKEKKPIRAKEFTLGRVAFTLCAKHGTHDREDEIKSSKERLVEFAKAKLLTDMSDEEILDTLAEYGEEMAIITNEYRNKAAHTNELKRVNAEMCFDMVLDVEKLLKRMMDSFAY